MRTAQQALEALLEGNRRFVAEVQDHALQAEAGRRYRLVPRQEPFAIIIGCSDARVPAEIVFDQGLGDLFVIRVAGNIIAVVLGHSGCGAIQATLEQLERPSENRSPNLRSIVDRIRPSVQSLLDAGLQLDSEQLVEQAVRANIRVSANQLRHGSEILEKLIARNQLKVVGAEYSLETGSVDFFDYDH
jgi:carbonic anhydrase